MSANETTTPASSVPTYDCRQTFVETLIELAQSNKRVVAVCNDSVGSSNLGAFAKAFPNRLINVGIAEQNMVGVAAGLANGGFIPFVCAAGPFLSGRATEQIKADLAYSNFPAILCAMSPGISYGELGPTHHSIEDFAWMRAISNLVVMAPADPAQTRGAMRWAVDAGKPTYMRIARFKIPAVTPDDQSFNMGKANVLRKGNDVTLIAIGAMVSRALDAANLLAAEGIQARVLNMATLKPLDADAVVSAARETRGIVTAEEGIIYGGLGSAVAEVTAQQCPIRMRLLGIPGFAPTGSASFLLEHFGLTADGIAAAARELIK